MSPREPVTGMTIRKRVLLTLEPTLQSTGIHPLPPKTPILSKRFYANDIPRASVVITIL